MAQTPAQKYRQCMVFSGGGAIAAAVIHTPPDPAQQKAWLASPGLYQFWSKIKPAPLHPSSARC